MVSRMRRNTTKGTRQAIKARNVKLCQKVSATAVRQAATQKKATDDNPENRGQLFLGPVVAWQPLEGKSSVDKGDFKAVVHGFTGGLQINTRVDIRSTPILPTASGILPTADPLISLNTSGDDDITEVEVQDQPLQKSSP